LREEIRKELKKYTEETYRDFSANLIPGEAKPLLGVRLPQLRKLAKDIVKKGGRTAGWQEEIAHYDGAYKDIYFEEAMLRGMIIGYGTAQKEITCDEGLMYLKNFIPCIENWSVCDSFCSSFVFANKYRKEVWDFMQPYLYSQKEFEMRVALILLLNQFLKYDKDNKKMAEHKQVTMADLCESWPNRELSVWTLQQFPYLAKILDTLNRAFTQGHYARMAAAWLMAETFVSFPLEANRMLVKNCKMDKWTYNKSLQKIRESLKPDKEVKEYVKNLKKR